MNLDENASYYLREYQIFRAYSLGNGPKKHIGTRGGNCRFCGLNTPSVSFKNVSHAVPEFLGNHQLIIANECDSCNAYFSRFLEDHLDKYTKPYRILGRIRGKTKMPSYKARNGNSRFDLRPNQTPKILARRDDQTFSIDFENSQAVYRFEVEPYVPVAVYKCLVKIGLSVLEDEELVWFKNAICWLLEEKLSSGPFAPLMLLQTFVPGHRPFKRLYVTVLRKKNYQHVGPHFVLLVAFGNVALQVILPSDLDSILTGCTIKLVPVPLPIPPSETDEVEEYSLEVVNLGSTEAVRGKVIPVKYVFDSINKAPEYEGKALEELGYKSSKKPNESLSGD